MPIKVRVEEGRGRADLSRELFRSATGGWARRRQSWRARSDRGVAMEVSMARPPKEARSFAQERRRRGARLRRRASPPFTSKPRETARMKRLEFGMAEGEELPLLELQRHEMERLRTLLDEQRATIARHRAELDAREETIREQQARLEAQAEELCALRQRCAGGERAGRVGGGAERSVGASPAEQLARALEDKAVLVAQLQRLVDAAAQARVEARRQAEVSQRSLAAAWRLGELGRAGIALVREASDPPTPT